MRCICFSMRTWRCFFSLLGCGLRAATQSTFRITTQQSAGVRRTRSWPDRDYTESCKSSSAWYRIAMQRTQNRRTKGIGLESSHTSRHVCDDVQKWLGKPSRSVATRLWQQMLPVAAASLYYACEGSMSCSRSTYS